jgi:hypothetical protein
MRTKNNISCRSNNYPNIKKQPVTGLFFYDLICIDVNP